MLWASVLYGQQSTYLYDYQNRKLSEAECIALAKRKEAQKQYRDASELYNFVASAHWMRRDYSEAIRYFNVSYEMNEQLGNRAGMAGINTQLGMIYTDVGNFEAAVRCFDAALAVKKDFPGQKSINLFSALINTAEGLKNTKAYDKAIRYVEEALVIAQSNYFLGDIKTCYASLGELYKLKGDDKTYAYYLNEYRRIYEEETKEAREQIAAEKRRMEQLAQEMRLRQAEQRAISAEQSNAILAQQVEEQRLLDSLNKINLARLKDLERTEALMDSLDMTYGEYLESQAALKISQHHNAFMRFFFIFAIGIGIFLAFGFWHYRRLSKRLETQNGQISAQSEALGQQAKELQRLNDLKNQLFSIVAHDLRGPLISIKGLLYLQENDLLSPEDFESAAPELRRELEYTSNLLENLLSWARSQMSGYQINPVPFSVSELIKDNYLLFGKAADTKGIALRIQPDEERLEALADRDMIDLALRNLLSNAVKFCAQGDRISISAEQADGFVKITVADTGIGMSQEQLEKIFRKESFSTRGTLNEKGTGLGLQLCMSFVAQNGGELWGESRIGEGTTFYFTVPMLQTSSQRAPLESLSK